MARQAPTQEIVVRQSFALPVAIALLAALLAVAVVRSAAPAPRTAAGGFSAASAREVLAELAGDGAPHPTGSPANAAVRDRIQAILRRHGLEPEVQAATVCRNGRCARIENVLARLPGREAGAVLLTAHYDSVGAGPGAGDDLAGVAAALEVARLLKAGPPLAHEVLVLLDDGEEIGLLGARAFAGEHPAAGTVRAVVNLEARGSSGPSMMFETSGASDRWLVSLYGGAAASPVSSSLFSFIYDRMPNDTDLTVWKERGVPGLNFAFIGNPLHYHTSRDEVARLSAGSLQHHGDNALASVRALAGAGALASPPAGEGFWFDVWRFFLVRWGAPAHLALAVLTGLLSLAAVVLALRAGTVRAGALGRGLLFLPAALVLTGLVTFLLFKVVGGAAFPAPWVAHPTVAQITFWMHGLLGVLAVGLLLASRRASFAGLWLGVWSGWALFAVLLSWFAPGLAYLFQLPALAAAVAGLVLFRRPEPRPGSGLLTLLPLAVAGLLWWPVLLPLYNGLGGPILPLVAILVALVASGLAPFVVETARKSRLALFFVALALSLGTAVGTALTPPFSADGPQPLNLQLHLDADSGQSRWLARGNPLPAGLREKAPFQLGPAFPWSPPYLGAHVAPAPAWTAPAPEVTVVADERVGENRRLRLRLRSLRGARVGVLALPAARKFATVTLDGKPLELARQDQGYRILSSATLPPEGSEFELVFSGNDRLEVYAADQSAGLPPAGAPLLAARGNLAVPFQDGDTTVVSRKLVF